MKWFDIVALVIVGLIATYPIYGWYLFGIPPTQYGLTSDFGSMVFQALVVFGIYWVIRYLLIKKNKKEKGD